MKGALFWGSVEIFQNTAKQFSVKCDFLLFNDKTPHNTFDSEILNTDN